MKTKKIILFSILISGFYFPSNSAAQDNRTFYQRGDGGVTVVKPTRNAFGTTTMEVRKYNSDLEAYRGEYPLETAIIEVAGTLLVEAGVAVFSWIKDSYDEAKQAKVNIPPPAPETSTTRIGTAVPAKEPISTPITGEESFKSGPGTGSPIPQSSARRVDSPSNSSRDSLGANIVEENLESLFGSAEEFNRLVHHETLDRNLRGEAIGLRGEVSTLGVEYQNEFKKGNDGKFYLVARVCESGNRSIQPGDFIYSFEGRYFSPGFDLGVALDTFRREESAYNNASFRVLRGDRSFDVSIPTVPRRWSREAIRERQENDAAEAVYLRRLIDQLGIKNIGWGNYTSPH
jgi:hypothetical protein